LKILLTCFLLLVAALPALAQDPPPIELGNVTFSGSIRERYEVWDWFQSPGNTQNLYGYSGTVIRFGFSQKREHFDWNIEFEAPLLLGIPDRAVRPAPQGQLGLGAAYFAANDGATNTGFIFLKQGFLRYKSGNSSFRLGRFEFTDGIRRVEIGKERDDVTGLIIVLIETPEEGELTRLGELAISDCRHFGHGDAKSDNCAQAHERGYLR